MARRAAATRPDLLQGTLDMLILQTLRLGRAHGRDIARQIQRTSEDVLQVEHGSLYPALHRLERRGWVTSRWEVHPERRRELRYYRLTPRGRRQLRREASTWRQIVEAIGRVMRPAERGTR